MPSTMLEMTLCDAVPSERYATQRAVCRMIVAGSKYGENPTIQENKLDIFDKHFQIPKVNNDNAQCNFAIK